MVENRKTKLVKSLLKDSLITLLNQKNIDKISVKELTELADINRSTFYSHYEDIYQLLQEITDEYMSKMPINETVNVSINQLIAMLDYMSEHKKIYLVLVKNGKYREYMFKKSMEVYDSGTIKKGAMLNTDRELYQLMVNFILAGNETIILQYLSHNVDFSTKKLATIMYDINTSIKNIVIKKR